MTTASGETDSEDVPSGYAFTLWAAGEVRASMARVSVRPAGLSRRLGVSQQWVHTRLTGKVPMTTADLARIAAALGMSNPLELFGGTTFPPRPPRDAPSLLEGAQVVDGGSTTHRYVARKRHLIAVDSLLDAPPSPSACPATARLRVDDDLSLDRRGARSPSAPGWSAGPLTTAVPA